MLFVLLLSSVAAHAAEPIAISDEMKGMAEKASQVKITPEMMERVRKTVEHINSAEYKKEMAAMQHAAEQYVDIEHNAVVDDDMKKAIKQGVIDGDIVYIFVSSSIPSNTLRNYVRHAAKIKNAMLILRGFVGGGRQVKPTASFVANILKKDSTCEGTRCAMYNVEIQIDPILYQRYAINRVPAVAYAENVHFEGYCSQKEEDLLKQTDRTVVYGDVALGYALKQIAERHPTPSLLETIDRLESAVK